MPENCEYSGREFHGYKILDKVKEGSVGAIYLAGRAGQLFALKIIFERHLGNVDRLNRFRREAKVARSLVHPNVIRTIDYFDGPPRPTIVLEYFPSENLKQLEAQVPKRLAARRYTILRQVAEGLHYCHQQGIVHRDVKPENVLVGEKLDAKLIDFSIATTRMERFFSFFNGRTAGSPGYMAPEQIQNKKVDHRADEYSLGAMAFGLLAGTPPFSGRSVDELLGKHLREPAPRITTVNPNVVGEVADLLDALLQKNPDARPPDLARAIYVFGKKEKDMLAARRSA